MSRRTGRSGWRRATWLALLLAILAGGLGACSLTPSQDAADSETGDVAVPVMRRDFRAVVSSVGELESDEASPVAVPPVPTGALTVKELAAEGSIVAAGDELVVFDESQLEIELSNHQATFRSTTRRIERTNIQAAIESGSIEVMRDVAVLERDHAQSFRIEDETIFSRLEILEDEIREEEAEETILFADASLRLRGEYYDIDERILDVERGQAEGKVGRVETSLANLVLKAPIGGMVVYKKNWRGSTTSVGDSLWPGNVIMSIVDPTQAVMRVWVLESDATGIVAGTPATVRVDARPDRVFRGTVREVAKLSRPIERGSPVKYFETVITLEDGDPELLKPGMKGEARIVAAEVEDALVIPRSAVRGAEGDFHVLVATAAGPEKRAVELATRDRVLVVVSSGLAEGELVLLGAVETGSAGSPERSLLPGA